ncbi:hypothetical protein AC1031_014635 [Aphanomyces cochlioides]|nr:hypothetical protein AC1031_014635 [Aphanomyces cochlioides]
MPVKAPVPPEYFDCPPLSQAENSRYVDMAEQSIQTLLQKAELVGGTYDWKLLKDDSELKIYKGHSTTKTSVLHCGVMQVVGELEENMEIYRYDTTEQAREYARRFGRACVDFVRLYTVLPRHPDRPNDAIHIKWVLAKSPLDGLVARRDFVVLESDLELKVGGKRAWVRAFSSIELDAVPDMRRELGCIRGYMYDMGFVVMESDRPGYLDMTYLADMDVRGKVPSWANDYSLVAWIRSMHDIDRFMRENRLSRTPFLREDQLWPLDSSHSCSLCRQKFGPLRKKTNCFKCGEVVCRGCNRLWNVNINGQNRKVRACVTCSLSASVTPAKKTSRSSRPALTPHNWTDILSQISEWTEDGVAATADDDVKSIDLSNYGDSGRERTEDVLVLEIPSMRRAPEKERQMSSISSN